MPTGLGALLRQQVDRIVDGIRVPFDVSSGRGATDLRPG